LKLKINNKFPTVVLVDNPERITYSLCKAECKLRQRGRLSIIL